MGKVRALGARYFSLGPILIDPQFGVGNQHEIASEIIALLESACQAQHDGSTHQGGDLVAEPHQVISVIGDRGSGKSSVLRTTCELVRESLGEKVLVTETIYPDRLVLSTDFPLAPAILRAIEKTAPCDTPGFGPDETKTQLSWAARLPETRSVLARETIGLEEWSGRLVEMIGGALDVSREFQSWVTSLLDDAQRDLLVVPIDDADIGIERVEEVVDTVRIYLAHPRIFCIVALDIDELQRRLRNRRLAALPPIPQLPAGGAEDQSAPVTFLGRLPAQFISEQAEKEQLYVEALLKKVLPPALRFWLSGLSRVDRTSQKVRIPGTSMAGVSLTERLSALDDACREHGAPRLADLFEKHPDVLSANIREYINQYLLIDQEVDRGIRRLREHGSEDESREWNDYRAAFDGRIGLGSEKAKASDRTPTQREHLSVGSAVEFLYGHAHARIVHALLASETYAGLKAALKRHHGTDLGELQTIHDIAFEVMRCGWISGTMGSRPIYAVDERTSFTEPAVSHLVGLLCDWAVQNGAAVADWIEMLGVDHRINEAFHSIEVSVDLAETLEKGSPRGLDRLDPVLMLNEGARRGQPTRLVSVPCDMDRLYPAFAGDFNAVGRYLSRVVVVSLFERLDEDARAFVGTGAPEDTAIRGESTHANLLRLMGLISIQSLRHIDALLLELGYDGDGVRHDTHSPFKYRAGSERSWLLFYLKGLPEALAQILRPEVPIRSRMLGATYMSDLPMRLVWSAVCGPEADKGREMVLDRVASLLDELQGMGVVSHRRLGTRGLGRLRSEPTTEGGVELMGSLSKEFPLMDWSRRWCALRHWLQGLQEARFPDAWDGLREPPPAWDQLANELTSAAKRRESGASTKTRKS